MCDCSSTFSCWAAITVGFMLSTLTGSGAGVMSVFTCESVSLDWLYTDAHTDRYKCVLANLAVQTRRENEQIRWKSDLQPYPVVLFFGFAQQLQDIHGSRLNTTICSASVWRSLLSPQCLLLHDSKIHTPTQSKIWKWNCTTLLRFCFLESIAHFAH